MSIDSSSVNQNHEQTTNELLQLVCFQLGEEDFGVDIGKVQEINRMVEITKIPQAAAFVEGVINLRGQIIPVIDMRARFGFEANGNQSKDKRIIVIETNSTMVGFIVDAVTEVLRIKSDDIEPTPDIVNSGVDIQYIQGVASIEKGLIIVLNTDLIFSDYELENLEVVAS